MNGLEERIERDIRSRIEVGEHRPSFNSFEDQVSNTMTSGKLEKVEHKSDLIGDSVVKLVSLLVKKGLINMEEAVSVVNEYGMLKEDEEW